MQFEMVRQVILYNRNLKACCQRCWNWLSVSPCGRKFSSGSDSGITDDNHLTFKEKLIRKHYFPDERQVELLHKYFPEPKKVVDDLFAPFHKANEGLVPKLEVKRQLRDSICKTKLTFNWPVATDVCGVHKDEDTSVLNAYLRACEFLKSIGLVKVGLPAKETSSGIYTVNDVVKILEELAGLQCSVVGYESNNFRVINLLQQNQDENVSWSSTLQVLWPICFSVNSNSTCLDLAYYQSCLKAVMKFKAFGYLDNCNHLKKGILLALINCNHLDIGFVTRDLTDPDYELFVDASAQGMGAYLISNDQEKIRWLADRWVPNKLKFDPRSNSNLAEFYAFVTAMYTWKHKFVNKKVICYCDNLFAINSINHGLYTTKNIKRNDSFYKLFLLLIEVCHQYNITIVGVHVPRIQNVAADLLSRYDVNSFKKIVPTAFEKPKKSKKLWFCSFNDSEAKDSKSNNSEAKDCKSKDSEVTDSKSNNDTDKDSHTKDDEDPKPSS